MIKHVYVWDNHDYVRMIMDILDAQTISKSKFKIKMKCLPGWRWMLQIFLKSNISGVQPCKRVTLITINRPVACFPACCLFPWLFFFRPKPCKKIRRLQKNIPKSIKKMCSDSTHIVGTFFWCRGIFLISGYFFWIFNCKKPFRSL